MTPLEKRTARILNRVLTDLEASNLGGAGTDVVVDYIVNQFREAIAEEREACAAIADAMHVCAKAAWQPVQALQLAQEIAAAIRQRGAS